MSLFTDVESFKYLFSHCELLVGSLVLLVERSGAVLKSPTVLINASFANLFGYFSNRIGCSD